MALLGAVAILLAGAAVARAEITASSVTEPAPSPYFAIVDEDTSLSPTIPFEGTTDSTAPLSDTVDLDCFTDNDLSQTEVFLGASVAPAGSFAAEANALNLAGKLCQLRAVPHGSPPADVTPFAGPITAVGRSRTEEAPIRGQHRDAVRLLRVWPATGRGNDYYSLSSCGVNGYLYDALEYTAKTFSCSDWYAGFDELNTPSSTRSEIQVDGTDAYGATAVGELANGAAGFPTFGFSYSQDPGNGDLTIEEDDQISTCPGQAYPPDGCPAFADSGVGDERRIEQTYGGRLVEITDRFSSTDGLPHNLDLLPQQGVRLSASSPAQVAYRFPGQSGFATHGSGESVPFAAGRPASSTCAPPGRPTGHRDRPGRDRLRPAQLAGHLQHDLLRGQRLPLPPAGRGPVHRGGDRSLRLRAGLCQCRSRSAGRRGRALLRDGRRRHGRRRGGSRTDAADSAGRSDSAPAAAQRLRHRPPPAAAQARERGPDRGGARAGQVAALRQGAAERAAAGTARRQGEAAGAPGPPPRPAAGASGPRPGPRPGRLQARRRQPAPASDPPDPA